MSSLRNNIQTARLLSPLVTPGLKSLQLYGASLEPLSCSAPVPRWGLSLHTPRNVPLVSHLLQNSARTNSQSDHLIITFVTNHYICNKCNKCIRDDTKAAARQNLNCIKNKNKQNMAKNDFQYAGWNSCTLQCGMWLWNRDSEFTKWQHPAM